MPASDGRGGASPGAGTLLTAALCRRGRRTVQAHGGVRLKDGGEGGIRTHGPRKGTPDFESGTFDHSATSPRPRFPEVVSGGRHSRPNRPDAHGTRTHR